jgi:hypothetical protein
MAMKRIWVFGLLSANDRLFGSVQKVQRIAPKNIGDDTKKKNIGIIWADRTEQVSIGQIALNSIV